ncbi:hypothetical protein [Kitasatospora sp. NPDC087314]|uniref:hypothetical protein n=1 Tax=Kitasatospora sp. NPDC087314 TaxID=3364068 RepID=UPI0037F4F50D
MKFSLAPTAIQAELLRWIAANPGAAVESSKTNTLWALEQRKLVVQRFSTREGRQEQTAAITEQGKYYLKHGRHPEEVEREAQRNARDPETAKDAPSDGVDLIRRLEAAGGTIVVPDPGVMTRGRWSRAFYHAVNNDLLSPGHKLRLTGREKGDLKLRLVDPAKEPPPPPPVPVIEVPVDLARAHHLITATRKALGRRQTGTADTRGQQGVVPIRVSMPLVDRALRIMQGLFTEAEQRGYAVEARLTEASRRRAEPTTAVVIIVKGHAFPLEICERTTKQPHEPTARELRDAEREPAWMRKRIPKYDHVPDGRLMIDAPGHDQTYGHRWYDCSDGTRWTLESRLGHLLAAIEERAERAEAERIRAEQAERLRHQRWLEAVDEAHQRLIRDRRLKALEQQLEARRTASEIRSLCAAVRESATGTPTDAAIEWLRWAEAHADSIDPVIAGVALPPDPPPSRQDLAPYLGSQNTHNYPWPFPKTAVEDRSTGTP